MKLSDWLEKQGLKPSQFAKKIGKSSSTITRIINGEHRPSLALMDLICETTNGAVAPNDFASVEVKRSGRR